MLTYVARTNQITALRYACSCQRVNQLLSLSLMGLECRKILQLRVYPTFKPSRIAILPIKFVRTLPL